MTQRPASRDRESRGPRRAFPQVGGCVTSATKELDDRLHFVQNMHGNIMTPHTAFLTLQSCKTMSVRCQQQAKNAMAVATFLSERRR